MPSRGLVAISTTFIPIRSIESETSREVGGLNGNDVARFCNGIQAEIDGLHSATGYDDILGCDVCTPLPRSATQ